VKLQNRTKIPIISDPGKFAGKPPLVAMFKNSSSTFLFSYSFLFIYFIFIFISKAIFKEVNKNYLFYYLFINNEGDFLTFVSCPVIITDRGFKI
jgi:hypothetical protein